MNSTHVKMVAYDEAGMAAGEAVFETSDGFNIGMFINRWLECDCTEIKILPEDQKGGDESA